MNRTRTLLQAPLLAALVASLTLVACQRRDETTAMTSGDTTTAERSSSTTTPPGGAESTATPGPTTPGTTAPGTTSGTTAGTAPPSDTAVGRAGSAVEDAAVTATINAELAKDPKLSALKIDVDTSNGRVSLKGKAPDADSRERATQIASAVRGVQSVDNQLQIGS